MKSWYDIYKERMNTTYLDHVKTKYKPFVDKILDYRVTQYFELGCGAGNITRVIRESDRYVSEHTLIDMCPKMLGLAIENNPSRYCTFKLMDIAERCYFISKFEFTNLAHSHGVLEHFPDDDIIKICQSTDKFAGIQVHYVPTAKYEKPSRGDERLLTREEWVNIGVKVKNEMGRGVIMSTIPFNDGYDLMVIFRREFR